MRVAFILLLSTFVAGCAATTEKAVNDHYQPETDAQASGLEAANLVYTPLPALPSRGVELASYAEEKTDEPVQRVLSITYPHPSGDKFKALAEVVVRNPDFRREEKSNALAKISGWLDRSLPGVAVADDGSTAYRLSLTKSEVDALLRQLAAQGMLEPQTTSTGDSELSLTINGKARELKIGRERTLEELSARVVAEGRVVSIHDESVATLPKTDSESAVKKDSFYESLLR